MVGTIVWELCLFALCATTFARQVLELQGVNFELALTSYKYAAILFYDESQTGQKLKREWLKAAESIGSSSSSSSGSGVSSENDMYEEAEMAMINSADPDIQELVDAYSIVVPCIKVFRRGIMSDYRGPLDAVGMATYVPSDSMPSVKIVASLSEMKQKLKKDVKHAVVLGFFDSKDVAVEDSGDVYSIEPWGQFQAAADSLRGHAVFYCSTAQDILDSFQVKQSELPSVYMVTEDGQGLLPYTGEILEMNLSEWVLRHSSPSMGELTLAHPAGEVFATQFFSARKLKFILFLRSVDDKVGEDEALDHWRALEQWRKLAETFKGSALFAYMENAAVPDVVEYFQVDVAADLPLVVAHDPLRDHKFKSGRLALSGKGDGHKALEEFVAGVITGVIRKLVKSEPVPTARKPPKPVLQVVGSNVVSIVSQPDKDVLLEVYAPWCAHCKRLRPAFDILGRAVQAESRIVIAKIDGTANDLPASWSVKNYPALLWFPAKDKPYKGDLPVPRPYWDAGNSLHELVSFVQRSSSFDAKTLKIATSEQIGSLMGDEETLRQQYELEDRWQKRNEGREVHSQPQLDWLAGEVIFDGKRWHVAAAGALVLVTLLSLLFASTKGSKANNAPKMTNRVSIAATTAASSASSAVGAIATQIAKKKA